VIIIKNKEAMVYVNIIKSIIDNFYEKEMLFYNKEDGWYSRYHSKYLTIDELDDFIRGYIKSDC